MASLTGISFLINRYEWSVLADLPNSRKWEMETGLGLKMRSFEHAQRKVSREKDAESEEAPENKHRGKVRRKRDEAKIENAQR